MGLNISFKGTAIRDNDGEELARRVKVELTQYGDRAARGISDEIRKGAEEIQETAREMAPYADEAHGGSPDDQRHLQEAIEVKVMPDPNRRLAMRVFVNGARPDGQGRPIARYAYIMHEALVPFGSGSFEASESTLAKGGQAGGRYLERAYEAHAKTILQRAEDRARKAFKS